MSPVGASPLQLNAPSVLPARFQAWSRKIRSRLVSYQLGERTDRAGQRGQLG
jgi:hypothetical protein